MPCSIHDWLAFLPSHFLTFSLINKRAFKVFQQGMLRVLFAEYGVFRWYAPVDAEAIVKNADAAVRFGMVKLVALVLEHGRLAQHRETVGETFRDKELSVVVLGQLYGHVLAVSG